MCQVMLCQRALWPSAGVPLSMQRPLSCVWWSHRPPRSCLCLHEGGEQRPAGIPGSHCRCDSASAASHHQHLDQVLWYMQNAALQRPKRGGVL